MGQIKNIKLHIVTDIKNKSIFRMAAVAVAPPVVAPTLTLPAQKPASSSTKVLRHKDTVRVSALTNRPISGPPKVDVYWCEPCRVKLTTPLASLKHFTGKQHLHVVNVEKHNLKRKQGTKAAAPPAKVAKPNYNNNNNNNNNKNNNNNNNNRSNDAGRGGATGAKK